MPSENTEQRKLTAIMFTDMVGYNARAVLRWLGTMRRPGDRTARAHLGLLQPIRPLSLAPRHHASEKLRPHKRAAMMVMDFADQALATL